MQKNSGIIFQQAINPSRFDARLCSKEVSIIIFKMEKVLKLLCFYQYIRSETLVATANKMGVNRARIALQVPLS